MASAVQVKLPKGQQVACVSLPAMLVLKFAAWKDRRYRIPRGKDASDLKLLIDEYIYAGNRTRIFDVRPHFQNDDDFFPEFAGAWLMGHDVAEMLINVNAADDTIQFFHRVLEKEVNAKDESALISDMKPFDPDKLLKQLENLLNGFKFGLNVKSI
jgi:predicted nucleotidyltransferase